MFAHRLVLVQRRDIREAWNPQGLSIGQGMGSSISLTLWAFLGMESAAQNSDAVENPKRNVPLACMMGTLGAAVIYVLSTTVIQGIMPNKVLAESTGPFADAYAQMFNPTVGTIIIALAMLACLGSLLGWQFTIAQTGKTAADERMFPSFFAKVNRMDAPVIGMIVMGVVQTLLALSTISPTLSEQFSVLVNLAVVTNVIPYIIALSALMVIMRRAGSTEGKYRFNVAVALVACCTARMPSMPRARRRYGRRASSWPSASSSGDSSHTVSRPASPPRHRPEPQAARRKHHATGTIRRLGTVGSDGESHPSSCWRLLRSAFGQAAKKKAAAPAAPAPTTTMERIRSTGTLKLGYRTDAPPFSFKDASGTPGDSVDLCQGLQEAVKSELNLPSPQGRVGAGAGR